MRFSRKNFLSVTLALAVLVSSTPAPAQAQTARIAIEQLPPVRIVSETREQLLALGCQPQAVTEETRSISVAPDYPYPVAPANTQAAELLFCSKATVDRLTVQSQVAVIWFLPLLVKAGIGILGTYLALSATGTAVGGGVKEGTIFAITKLLDLLSQGANYFLHLAAEGIVPLLTAGSFFTDPLVTKGWPIVLGLSNLGFVLALLFIAITTILRISGFDARRLLVRLLIAALLINFSLVIGVLIIDLSRLVMAGIYTGMSGESINNLAGDLINKSQLVNQIYKVDKTSLERIAPSTEGPLDSLLAFLSLVILLAGFVAVLVGLLIRYLMLILLLIISPLAYLFLALPGTGHLAKKWWDQFIRYVVYGPAVVFILGLFASLNEAGLDSLSAKLGGETFGAMAMLILTAVFLFGAAMAGKYVGAAAAGAAAGWVAGQTFGRAGSALKRGAQALPGAALSTGRQAVTQPFIQTANLAEKIPFVRRMQGRRAGRLEEKARLKEERRKQPFETGKEAGRQAALRKYGPSQMRDDIKEVQQKSQVSSQMAIAGRQGVFNAAKLGQSHVASELRPDQLTSVGAMGDPGQVNALANALRGLPAAMAHTFVGQKVDAVLATNNIDLIRGMVSNPEIVSKMSADHNKSVEQVVQQIAPQPANIQQFPANATPAQIATTQQQNAREEARYQRELSDQKALLSAYHESLRSNAQKAYGG